MAQARAWARCPRNEGLRSESDVAQQRRVVLCVLATWVLWRASAQDVSSASRFKLPFVSARLLYVWRQKRQGGRWRHGRMGSDWTPWKGMDRHGLGSGRVGSVWLGLACVHAAGADVVGG